MKKLLIVGHFAGNLNVLNGQTIKTRTLFNALSKYSNFKIKRIDTYYKDKQPFKLFIESILSFIVNKDIIVLLSTGGIRFYFPILFLFAVLFKKRIYYDVIGGELPEFIKKHYSLKKYINSFVVTLVETIKLQNELINIGISNTVLMVNFKDLPIVKLDFKRIIEKKLRFCTFSRVMKEKGICEAVEAIKQINNEGKFHCFLDIYGQIDKNQIKWFDKLQKTFTNEIKYCGSVSFNESVKTLSDYYALLFPTNFSCEGIPGTIVDAYCSGIPVIATQTSANSEIIKNYSTGLLYPLEDNGGLKKNIEFLIENKALYIEMCHKCVKEAEKYLPKHNIKKIIELINHQ